MTVPEAEGAGEAASTEVQGGFTYYQEAHWLGINHAEFQPSQHFQQRRALYHGMLALWEAALSPSSAESGTKRISRLRQLFSKGQVALA